MEIISHKKIIIILSIILLVIGSIFLIQPVNSASNPTFQEENSIIILPTYKNNTFNIHDTIIIKVTVPYKGDIINKYHIKVNITKPDSSKIQIDDYVYSYSDPAYYIEMYIDNNENGTWIIDTYTEYKTSMFASNYNKYNNGSKEFTVLQSSGPSENESIQIIPINTYFAYPNNLTLDLALKQPILLAARVQNSTANKSNIFTRFSIINSNNETIFTNAKYTGEDGIISINIPPNTLLDIGNYIIEITASKAGTELNKTFGMIYITDIPKYFGENQISLLPYYKNNTFYEKDTIIIKINTLYKTSIISQYHIKINITKPDSSIIKIEDYVRNYFDPAYYIELPIANNENGTWKISTYSEYSITENTYYFEGYNVGSLNFTVLALSEKPQEIIQIVSVNKYYASPNIITITETGSTSSTIAIKTINNSYNIPDVFIRLFIYNENNETIYTDSGYTADDGIITKTIPVNTFFIEGDYLIYIFASKSGIELDNTTGVLHVRYIASPDLYPFYKNQNNNITTYFIRDQEIWIDWNWSLYTYNNQPDTINCKVKLISNSNKQKIYEKEYELNILTDKYNIKSLFINKSTLNNIESDNYTIVLQMLSLDNNNYEMIIGHITINTTIVNTEPDNKNNILIIIAILIIGIGIGSVVIISIVINSKKKQKIKPKSKIKKRIKFEI